MSEPEPPLRTLAWLDSLPTRALSTAVADALAADGRLGPVHHLRDERFAPCRGCWECWVEHPGTCTAHDAGNDVMRDTIGSDGVLWTTRLTFGGWDPIAKAALDKSIGLISPFFTSIEGETHHHRRYPSYPRTAALAVTTAATTAREREVFRWLVERNVLNMRGPRPWVGFVDERADPATVRATVRDALSALDGPAPDGVPQIGPYRAREDAVGVPPRDDRPRHVTLWVGSAKPRATSTSEALGRALVSRLDARGWTTETIYVARAVRLGRDGAPALVDAVRRADLLVLSCPVYVDSLPALVVAGLQQLARADLGQTPPAFVPIVQCGFPELTHTGLALEILDVAARTIGLGWAGHLALGGGGAIDGRDLADIAGQAHHQLLALQAAATSLDAGEPIAPATTAEFAHTVIGPGAYRALGQLGWLGAAAKAGSLFDLWDRPFATPDADV